MYQKIVDEFLANPRDVHTVPTTKAVPKWFHVSVENGYIVVESAHGHSPKCALRKRRLQEAEANRMLGLYYRRKRGEPVSKEAVDTSRSHVYWYGIFSELNL